MHGHNENNMEEIGGSTGFKSRSGCPQRSDADRSLVSRIPQHRSGTEYGFKRTTLRSDLC